MPRSARGSDAADASIERDDPVAGTTDPSDAVADSDGSGSMLEADGARRGRLAVLAGGASLVYVLWYVGDLVVLAVRPSLSNAFHRTADNVGVRTIFAGLFLAIVFHGADGLRCLALDLRPRLARRDALLRALVGFVTTAVTIPVTVLLVWPSVRSWFS